jgi:hypothetical protein
VLSIGNFSFWLNFIWKLICRHVSEVALGFRAALLRGTSQEGRIIIHGEDYVHTRKARKIKLINAKNAEQRMGMTQFPIKRINLSLPDCRRQVMQSFW